MHDEVAGSERSDFGDEILRAPCRFSRSHQAVAKNVLLADDGEVLRLEALLETENGECNLVRRPRERRRPVRHADEIQQAMIDQNVAHALARAFAP